MYLRHLSLTNFRMYARLELDLHAGLTIIQGDNAQGKTTLLEAMRYLATGRSMHTNADRQIIRWGALDESPFPYVILKGEMQRKDGARSIEMALQLTESSRLKKEIKIDHASKRGADLVGQLAVVLFLPNDVDLVAGAPTLRREFLDDAISQVSPIYTRAHDQYTKALTQRNALLKQAQDRRVDADEFVNWETLMADAGVEIALARDQFARELQSFAAPIHQELSNNAEYLQIAYQPNFDPTHPNPFESYQTMLNFSISQGVIHKDELRATLLSAYATRRGEEIVRGSTVVGPHRDEMRLLANQMDIGEFGSRGQQRTSVLALKLAQVEWMRAKLDDEPVLLLDEVLAELDPHRRRSLLKHIHATQQTIITTTDVTRMDASYVEGAHHLFVSGGIVHNTP